MEASLECFLEAAKRTMGDLRDGFAGSLLENQERE